MDQPPKEQQATLFHDDVGALSDKLSRKHVPVADILNMSDEELNDYAENSPITPENPQKTLFTRDPSQPIPNAQHDEMLRIMSHNTTGTQAYIDVISPNSTRQNARSAVSRLLRKPGYRPRLDWLRAHPTNKDGTLMRPEAPTTPPDLPQEPKGELTYAYLVARLERTLRQENVGHKELIPMTKLFVELKAKADQEKVGTKLTPEGVAEFLRAADTLGDIAPELSGLIKQRQEVLDDTYEGQGTQHVVEDDPQPTE